MSTDPRTIPCTDDGAVYPHGNGIRLDKRSNFMFLWTTDTQYYAKEFQSVLTHQNDWVLANKDSLNIKYTFQSGDVVDEYPQDNQWVFTSEEYKKWDAAGFPYGILAGNHDVYYESYQHDKFQKHYGKSRYNGNSWYGGDYDNNRGHYDLMTIDDTDFIFLHMGYSNFNQADYDWMNTTLKAYETRVALLNFYDYLNVDGTRSAYGEKLFHNVVLKNKNVRLVLCGHYHGAARRVDQIDDSNSGTADRQVLQVLSDYQCLSNGGEGFMRFLECDKAAGTISFRTYSPKLDSYNCFPNDEEKKDEFGYQDEFTVPFDFSAPTPKSASDPEIGDVLPSEKVIFKGANGGSDLVISVNYFNTPEPATTYKGVGVYDRNFSLDTTDIISTAANLNFVIAQYDGTDYQVTQIVKKTDAYPNKGTLPIPENGIVIAIADSTIKNSGATSDNVANLAKITIGAKLALTKLPSVASPTQSTAIRIDILGTAITKGIKGINTTQDSADNWLLYDSRWGSSTDIVGVDMPHRWDMVFVFEPKDGDATDVFTVTEVYTTIAAAKVVPIPSNGFVIAANTASEKPSLAPSIKKHLAVGAQVRLISATSTQ